MRIKNIKIDAVNTGDEVVIYLNDYAIFMDSATDEEVVELLQKAPFELCEEDATHLSSAIFSLSYVVE
ncbi:hypothetical protein PP428_gp134 [Escherichia phage vB_EcoM_RZ]|jgi:hypothetical protein|uniref:Phage protein n=5 Tax=Gaprivervirus TaxID=1913654 RepID=A0A0A7HDA9_9CAUD|nr:hypothetical protein SP18_gp105 [Shigella phage SP18]YP_004063791.1 MobD.5 hypothetical protein [Escherichia phage vB_EcoM_VR7]YP_009207281.1 hypothetical protein AVV68_gp102 [Escherichia phage vB_EcoM_VR20]YP_009213942.1 hypothetical protein AVV66_gp105 [Escherichia phage vB_EcoM_VR26]YP_010650971.1 hypothetical protein PP428_gp134 [Escherichia phage vB_EcoM_RZ]QIN95486.1 hypothetical protein MN01_00108 [Escherichia phage MN01]QQG30802.1 molybdopterin-guanine dinucleotide biosynthesis pro